MTERKLIGKLKTFRGEMKKIISLLFAVLISVSCLMLVFPLKTMSANAADVYFHSESQILNKETLIGTEKHNYSATVATEELNSCPLSLDTYKAMSGYIVSPVMDKYAQINSTFMLENANFSENKSIYMWMYFPELPLYDLQITLRASDSSVISWTFESDDLLSMITENSLRSVYCGWKFIEFSINDSDQAKQGIPFTDKQLVSMNITFKPPVNISIETESETISFYNVYMADSFSGESQILYHQDYTSFKIKDDFLSNINRYYLNDTFKINGIFEVFDTVFVGKLDIRNYGAVSRFTWKVVIQSDVSAAEVLDFGQGYNLKREGWYSVNIKLVENIDGTDTVILNTSHSFYCEKFNPGYFDKTNYYFDVNKKYIIKFHVSSNTDYEDIVVEIADKNIANSTYYVKDGVCYIEIEPLKKGKTDLSLALKAKRADLSVEKETFEYNVKIRVDDYDITIERTIMWVIFGVFCVAILIFVVISFVKARKFSVK